MRAWIFTSWTLFAHRLRYNIDVQFSSIFNIQFSSIQYSGKVNYQNFAKVSVKTFGVIRDQNINLILGLNSTVILPGNASNPPSLLSSRDFVAKRRIHSISQ